MNCEFGEKVSMLIDGELSESESQKARAHIAGCAQCRDLEKDFLFFREQIKESAADFVAGQIKTPLFLSAKRLPFWKKGILLPAPVFAGFILIAVGLSVWLIASRFSQNEKAALENSVKNAPAKAEIAPNEISIARFDKGGRAEIYVAPREAK
jgi:Putative zinc-finger